MHEGRKHVGFPRAGRLPLGEMIRVGVPESRVGFAAQLGARLWRVL